MTETDLEIVALSDREGSLEATLVPGAGMVCCSLCHRGEELLAQNEGLAAYAQRGRTMGVPLLYPWANRLAGFHYSVDGQAVTVPDDTSRVAVDGNGLPIHGVIGGRLQWTLVDAPVPESSVLARLTWDESRPELFEMFPFHHDVHYLAQLAAGRLTVTVTVDATGSDVVPVAFGFHPYLSLPGVARKRLQVALPSMRHLQLDASQIPVAPERMLPARRFELGQEELDDGFDALAEPACFSVAGGGREITLDLLEGYGCAQVYAPRESSFICFEPMTAPANALCSGDGLRVLAPGERHRATFSLQVR